MRVCPPPRRRACLKCPLRRRSSSKRALIALAIFRSNLARTYFARQESASDSTSKRLVPRSSRLQESLDPEKRNPANRSHLSPPRSRSCPIPAVKAAGREMTVSLAPLLGMCFTLYAGTSARVLLKQWAAALIAASVKLTVLGRSYPPGVRGSHECRRRAATSLP